MEDSNIIISGYEIEKVLGSGGMATVYLAIQKSFEREVAIKIMSKELSSDPTFGERFLREAKIVSRLVHPNIVTVYNVGVSNGHHFLSMEYVAGVDLKEQLNAISFYHVIKVIKETALALNYAGNKGYVHRDIKPENIMISEDDGRAVLMDFGIAKAFDSVSGMTQTGTAIGTPYYMSPEQAKGKEVDSRSDIYSLGIVFFQLLTGKVPYNGDSAVSVGIKHISDPIPSLPAYLSESFQAIIGKLLAKHRKDRYQNGLELINDINKIPESSLSKIAETFDSEDGRNQLANVDIRTETPLAHFTSNTSKISSTPEDTDATQIMSASIRTPKVPETKLEQFVFTLKNKCTKTFLVIKEQPYGVPIAAGVAIIFLSSMGYFLISKTEEPTVNNHSEINNIAIPKINNNIEEVNNNVEEQTDIVKSKNNIENEKELIELLSQAKIIEDKFNNDIKLVDQLHQIYQKVSAFEENHPIVEKGYENIKQTYLNLITTHLDAEQYQEANLASSKLLELFPELATSEIITALNEQINSQLELNNLFETAEEYLSNDKLSGNDEQNANYYYKKILLLAPNNKKAIKGLFTITERYYSLAESMLNQNRPNQALSYIERGLSIPQVDNDRLSKLKNQIINEKKQQGAQKQKQETLNNEIEQLLTQARTYLRANALISPSNENALHVYNKVIKLDKRNKRAIEGLKDIEVKLVTEIKQYINEGNFDLAGTKVNEASFVLPNNKIIKETQQLLKAERAEAIANAKPQILQLSVSGTELKTIDESKNSSVKADRTVYIGFSYNNLETETSLLHAELRDGSKTVKIRTVPVIVAGKSGEKFFKISRPVTGFPEGGYYIYILLNQETLISSQFSVKR